MTITETTTNTGGLQLASERITVLDKWTGEIIAERQTVSGAEVDTIVRTAVAAAEVPWAPDQRERSLRRAVELLQQRKEHILETMIRETGYTRRDVENEFSRAMSTLSLCAEEAIRITGAIVPVAANAAFANSLALTVRVPIGVVLAVTPFNAPLNTPCHKIGPALAAGNAVILKPAELTPLTAEHLVSALHDAGVPRGRLQIAHGRGETAGHALLTREEIGFTTFTGSTAVGTVVKSATGVRPVSLELGSISPTLVCEGADVAHAAEQIVRGSFRKAGQVCTSVQIVYAHTSLADELTTEIVRRTKSLVTGDPWSSDPDFGPVISTEAADHVTRLIEASVAAGAQPLTGGGRTGTLIEPVVLGGVRDGMPITREEAFGPVVGITTFDSIDDAIARVNAGRYGLQAGVFTDSLDITRKVALNLQVGGVVINGTSSTRSDGMPFGGQKDSGFGKEGPEHAVREMSVERLVFMV
ncbi:aldehyde dehydrogenase family protein [Rhodococcus sp. NPDC057014]|uniref:aldehyde dehydrogenase family protein n=1 Tax=Rhodococcus sp. NPDC057014 TaxID=3346000 RepID=UPI003629A692